MKKIGAFGAIAATLVLGFVFGAPHLPEWTGNGNPAVVSKSPAALHPEDRHEEEPSEIRPLDRQKTNIATASIAVPQEIPNPEPHVGKGSERVRGVYLASRGLSFPSLEAPTDRLFILGLVMVGLAAALIFLVRRTLGLLETRSQIGGGAQAKPSDLRS